MEFKIGAWKDYKKTSMRKEMAFYKLMIENSSDAILRNSGMEPNIPVTHWSWYYPVSNHFFCEKVVKATTTALMKSIARLIKAYEDQSYPEKFFAKTCMHCSFFPICDEQTWL